jgi:hypothetical protein
MSDGITAMYDAMEHYEWLCQRYDEKPHYTTNRWGDRMLDCYGKHALTLGARYIGENRK